MEESRGVAIRGSNTNDNNKNNSKKRMRRIPHVLSTNIGLYSKQYRL